jgi:hypothetical protein
MGAMSIDRVPPREIFPGVTVRGALAFLLEAIEVRRDPTGFVAHAQMRVPHVDTGTWGSVGMSERGDLRRDTERAVVLRLLRRMWLHEWDEALEVDGEVVGHPHG